jgi:uncharacterized protein
LAEIHNAGHKLSSKTIGKADMLIVELAALFHDLFDSKYTSANTDSELDISSWLTTRGVPADQCSLILKIISNVSYSKEIVLRKNGGWTKWHENCAELHCVMDADKLDALGAFGIFRCGAFSGSRNIPLYLPKDDEMYKKCAIAHFGDKLFRLENMMMTETGSRVARRRTAIMKEIIRNIKEEEELLDFEI